MAVLNAPQSRVADPGYDTRITRRPAAAPAVTLNSPLSTPSPPTGTPPPAAEPRAEEGPEVDDENLLAAVLTAGVLIRMPGASPISGDPERDRAARATEAVETYCAVLKALRLAMKAGQTEVGLG